MRTRRGLFATLAEVTVESIAKAKGMALTVSQVKVDLIEVGSFKQEEDRAPVYDVTVVLHVTSDFGKFQ